MGARHTPDSCRDIIVNIALIMKEYIADGNEAGRRIDRFIRARYPQIGIGKLNKLLRERGITVNKKKVRADYRLIEGDIIRCFFDPGVSGGRQADVQGYWKAYEALKDRIRIVFECTDVLIADKPAGVLSQRAGRDDISINEWLTGYLLTTGEVSAESLAVFRPSVCNRLDMNTSGLIICGKTLKGSRIMSEVIRQRRVHKYYHALVHGSVTEPAELSGYLVKDTVLNRVTVSDTHPYNISLSYKPLSEARMIKDQSGNTVPVTLLEVELRTGKPHQIRAQLAAAGYPILFDPKYGDRQLDGGLKGQRQLLHCTRLEFDSDTGIKELDGVVIESPCEMFSGIM